MKIKTLLIAVVLVLGLAAPASASTQWTVGASPEPVRVATGYTEKVGVISFNTVENANYTVTGTITIDYGKTITVPATSVNITTFCGGTSPCPGAPNLNDPANKVIEDGTKLVIRVFPASSPVLDYGFTVDGVRIDVTGYGTGEFIVNAIVTAAGNQITNGQATALVLQRISNPFASFTNTTASNVSVINGTYTGTGGANVPVAITLNATEGFRNAFWQINASDPTQTNPQQIYITPVSSIPAGISLAFPNADNSGHWTRVGTDTLSGNGTITYTLTSNSDVTAVENFVLSNVMVSATTAVARGSVYPVDTTVYLRIDLGPFPNNTTPYNSTNVPRYKTQPLTSAAPAITFRQDFTKTILMVPYASDQSVFDTGLAVANTTLDPFEDGDLNGVPDNTYNNVIDGAIAQSGKIVFYLYPTVGNPFMVSTATLAGNPIPGHNTKKVLDAAGNLPAGKTYSILLSQLVAAGGYAEDTFEGYILAVCDFTNAHGQYFVAYEEFNSFSNGAVMLVVSGNFRAGITESLGQ